MAKNLIQRMQGGGPAIILKEYTPGEHFEKALADTTEYYEFHKELEENARQFDERAELEGQRISIMAQDVQGRQNIAKMESERHKIDDARDDFFRAGKDQPPARRVALGYQYGLDDLAEQASQEQTRSEDAMAEINSIRKSVATGEAEPVAIKNVLDKHSVTIGEMSSWNSGYINEINRDLEGYAAKEALLSLKDTIGQNGLARLGVNTSKWVTASPAQARNYLASLPLSIKTVRDLKADDISNIKDMAKILSDSISGMEESGVANTQRYIDAIKMHTDIIDRYSTQIGFGEAKTETEEELLAKEQAKFTTVSTKRAGDKPVRLEKNEIYYVTYTDNKGKQRKSKMTGKRAEEQVTKHGNKLISADRAVEVIGKNGVPSINVNSKVKDSKTGKILTYTGTSYILDPRLGGAELLYFEDSSGNIDRYTKKSARERIFTVPTKEESESFDVRYAQKIPQDVEEGGSWWEGMLESATAAQRKAAEKRRKAGEARNKGGMQEGGMVGDTTQARLDEIDKILGPVPSEAAME